MPFGWVVTGVGEQRDRSDGRYVPLFWRLLIPNASVLVAACVVLLVEPANGRIVALAGGLTVMLVVNAVLMRHAFAPLVRLTSLMGTIDPLKPGRRIPALGPKSEVSTLAEAFNEMLERLETERRESARRASLGQEAERRRLAAELHDEIGQNLTAVIIQLDRLAKRVPDACRDELLEAAATARASLDEVRGLARRLRPEVLDALGLGPALGNLCDRLANRTGLAISYSLDSQLPPLPEDVQLVIYRVTQESLTNVVRHAHADRAEVRLSNVDGHFELSVSDDGVGFPDAIARSDGGLRSMRERAVLVGGTVDIDQSELGGAAVRLRVPRPDAPTAAPAS